MNINKHALTYRLCVQNNSNKTAMVNFFQGVKYSFENNFGN
jgi:hypothetical protein